jgi:hypothetical protein
MKNENQSRYEVRITSLGRHYANRSRIPQFRAPRDPRWTFSARAASPLSVTREAVALMEA